MFERLLLKIKKQIVSYATDGFVFMSIHLKVSNVVALESNHYISQIGIYVYKL